MVSNDIMVSVVMLCYNHEKYIRQALESVVNQKTTFPFEAIVHDDASTDNSAAIIREFAERYPNIIRPIYQTENQYSKKADMTRRIIIPMARGKYMASCEGDDFWCDENKLQKQVDFLESHSEYIATAHNCIFVGENGEPIKNIYPMYREYRNHVFSLDRLATDTVYPGQTATVVYRKHAMVFSDAVQEDAFYSMRTNTGDKRRYLQLLLQGDIYCFEQKMSAYRIVTHNGNSWSARNKGRNISYQLHIASIDFRKYAKDYYDKRYSNYYTTFHTGVAGVLKYLLKRNPENKIVFNQTIQEHGGLGRTVFYLFGVGILSIPGYLKRKKEIKRYDPIPKEK